MEWKVLKKGVKYYGESDMDGWLNWWVLDAKEWENYSDEDIFYYLNLGYYYSGPGQFFAETPYIRCRTSKKILVCHSCGYDV